MLFSLQLLENSHLHLEHLFRLPRRLHFQSHLFPGNQIQPFIYLPEATTPNFFNYLKPKLHKLNKRKGLNTKSYLPPLFNYMSRLQEVLGSHGDVIVLICRIQVAFPAQFFGPIETGKSHFSPKKKYLNKKQ